jgi:Pilus formation protein N terminal region
MKSVRLLFLSAACASTLAATAVADPVSVAVSVPMDNVALVSFKTPVTTVYIGNPSIAELTVIDSRHVFVMGKRFGATNLIALGADKKMLENDPVVVSSRHAEAVTVFRGPDTFNYICTGFHCETRPVPGDPKVYFDNTEGAAGEHEEAGSKTGGSTTQGGTH